MLIPVIPLDAAVDSPLTRTIDPVTAQEARGLALVVDDEPANCRLLSLMLNKEGFLTREAQSGEAALACFAAERPDIVFMDVMLPGMDGLEATRRIKELAGMEFVPVIFLTALSDDQTLLRCIEAGGDDFLSKPFNFTVLRARILAMERVRNLQRTITAKQRLVSALLEQDREEQLLAERVLSRAVMNRNVALDKLGLIQRPATIFNGDLVLTQYLPDGGLRLLLGDFTGHGLAAAMAALPVAEVFHAITAKGIDDEQLLREINRKLYQLLPADRFMGVCLLSISSDERMVSWWNGGMPSAWLRTADGLRELSSHALPLGILPELATEDVPQTISLHWGDALLMMSDGLLEACNEQGLMFCHAGFDPILNGWEHASPVLPALSAALEQHCAATEQADDIAVVEILLTPELFGRPGRDLPADDL